MDLVGEATDTPQFRWGNPYFFSENRYQSVSFIYASMYRENVHAIHMHVPPLEHLKEFVCFDEYLSWCTCLAKLAYRLMNIAGDERMCGKYLCRASESGRFLET